MKQRGPVTWVLNLDAEDELAHGRHHTPSRALEARVRALLPILTGPDGLVSGEDEVLWPSTTVPLKSRRREGRTWCPTPWALAQLGRADVDLPPAPSLPVLRRVNHRRFSHELGQGLPGAGFVEDVAALQQLLSAVEILEAASPSARWLLKRAYGFAGRGRRAVKAGELTAEDRAWVAASLQHGAGIQVEPWVEREADFALHGWVDDDGALTLGRPTVQIVDTHGAWQATRLVRLQELASHEEHMLRAEAQRAGQALAQAGYFGPFGIDAFRWRAANGGVHFQPRSEINARYSMGWSVGMRDA